MYKNFALPRLHDTIPRKRLHKYFDDNPEKRIFIVQGQAAQGKSTFVASYLHRCEECVIWLNLGEGECDHTSLFDFLITALSSTRQTRKATEKILHSHPTLGAGETLNRQIAVIRSVFSGLSDSVNIVFDNLEFIQEHSPSFEFIKKILEELPENIRIFLISRTMPSFNMPQLKMETPFLLVKNNDLAFTLDETRYFFRMNRTLTLPLDEIQRIHAITDGWAGGLALISTSLERNREGTELPRRLTAEASDYFSREIFALLPESVKDFLIKSSIFDEIDPEIAAEISNHGQADEILGFLEKRNLFIQKLTNGGKQYCYRFNTLFRSFLQQVFREKTPVQEYRALNQRAGHLFYNRGEYEQSVLFFVNARDWIMAGDMIKKTATDMIIKGKYTRLSQWIKTLPDKTLKADPWLMYYLTMTRRIKGGKKNVTDFLYTLALFKKQKDIRGIMLSTAHLIEAAIFLRTSSIKIRQWIGDAEALLKEVQEQPMFNWARASLWQQIGFGYIAGEIDIQRGISACKNAQLLARQIRNREIELNASIVKVFGYVRSGNFSRAEILLGNLKTLTEECIHPEYRALNNLVKIDFYLKQGIFDKAEQYLEISEKDVEKFGLVFLYPAFVELKVMHRIYTSKYQSAIRHTDHLSDVSILSGNRFYSGLSHHLKAMIFYHIQAYEKAINASKQAISVFIEKKDEKNHLHAAGLLQGLILQKIKKYEAAEKILTQALSYFSRISSDLAWTETHAALGLLHWEQNNEKQAKLHIVTAFNKAAEKNFCRFVVLSPADFSKLLLLGICFKENPAPLITLFTKFSTRFEKQVPSQLDTLLSHPFSSQCHEYRTRLKQVYKKTLPHISIKTMGQFKVLIDNKEIPAASWDGNKPKMLLKSIICRNGRHVSKEKLIDDIWPDATPRAGEKNFKVNLHRLRKVIEPVFNKNVGYSVIQLESGQVSLDPALVSVDIFEFIDLESKGRVCLAREEISLAMAYLKKAEALYKGDFLSEDPYEDWISLKRQQLSADYIDILMTLARLHEEMGTPQLAIGYLKKIIATDQLHEEAHQNLMIVYADMGMKKTAENVYKEWYRTIRQELDTEPDEETQNIYRKIKGLTHSGP